MFDVFLKALPRQTVIWIVDNQLLIADWEALLNRYFDSEAVNQIPLY